MWGRALHTLNAFDLPMPKTSWRSLGLSYSGLSARGELSLSDATFATRSYSSHQPCSTAQFRWSEHMAREGVGSTSSDKQLALSCSKLLDHRTHTVRYRWDMRFCHYGACRCPCLRVGAGIDVERHGYARVAHKACDGLGIDARAKKHRGICVPQ